MIKEDDTMNFSKKLLHTLLAVVFVFCFALSFAACSSGNNSDVTALQDKITALENELAELKTKAEETAELQDKIAALETELAELKTKAEEADELQEKIAELEAKIAEMEANNTYDFYVTLGTMPTLYATLNAYDNKNPNTYMWFYRGNTISKEYSAPFIQYFSTQSETNANSAIDYMEIRNKVREILTVNPNAKFHLYCDDLRVRFVLDLFVAAGVDFDEMQVTLLSDGTGSYSVYKKTTQAFYDAAPQKWAGMVADYEAHVFDPDYSQYAADFNNQAMELQYYAYYLSTFENVEYWLQHPDYLKNDALADEKAQMHLVKKNPKDMYDALDDATRTEYQKVVLANALVDSETLTTLEDAATYFNTQLANRDKEIVLILGTSYNGLDHNKTFIDQTIAYYTPVRNASDATKVSFKGKDYTVGAEDTTLTVDSKAYTIGEVSVYLFFKGHPAYPANSQLMEYFAQNNIVVLPHRTPVETLFWMFDVKAGGYQSTSFLSCEQGQTEFFYGALTNDALLGMQEDGFFDGAAIFTEEVAE